MQRGVQPGTTMHRYKVLGKKGEGTFSEVRCAGGVLCGMRGGGGGRIGRCLATRLATGWRACISLSGLGGLLPTMVWNFIASVGRATAGRVP